MKKRLLIAVLAAVAAISFGAFAGCDKGKVDPSEKIEIALSPQELVLEEGETGEISATASDGGTSFTWTSQNEAVAVVDGGLVTGISVGRTQIVVSYGGATARCNVTITEKEIDEPLLVVPESSYALDAGESTTVTVRAYSVDGLPAAVEQTDESVAEIAAAETVADEKVDIVVTGKNRGVSTVTLVVGTGESAVRASFSVTVKDLVEMSFTYPEALSDHLLVGESYDLGSLIGFKVNGASATEDYLENVETEIALKNEDGRANIADNVFTAERSGEYTLVFHVTVYGTDEYFFEESVNLVLVPKAVYGTFGNELSVKENTGWDLFNGVSAAQFSANPDGEDWNPTAGPQGSSPDDTYGILKIKAGTTGESNSAYVALEETRVFLRNLDAYKDNDRVEIVMYYGWNNRQPAMNANYWDFGMLDENYNLKGTGGASDPFKTAHPMPTAQWTVWSVTLAEIRELGITASETAALGFRIQPHKDASRDYCFFSVSVVEGIESGDAVYGELGNEIAVKAGNEAKWDVKNGASKTDFSANSEVVSGNPTAGPDGAAEDATYGILKIKTGTTGVANSVYVSLEGTRDIMRNLDSYADGDFVEITMYYGWNTASSNMNASYWDFGILDGGYNLLSVNAEFKKTHPLPTQQWVVWSVTIGELRELGAIASDAAAVGFRIQPHKDASRDICFYSVRAVKAE